MLCSGVCTGPVLFYIPAGAMDSGTEGTLSSFAGDTELEGRDGASTGTWRGGIVPNS